ncbi:MAG: hypothetical protein ACRDTG_04680 [Pseudonocardiaceae bacterium]
MGGISLGWLWLRRHRRLAKHQRDRTRPLGIARRRPKTGLAIAMPHVIAMIDTRTSVAHLVTDEAMAVGRRAGRYVALCGGEVLPGSLKEDTNRSCRSCRQRRATP